MRPALLAVLAALGCGAPGPSDPAPPDASGPPPGDPAQPPGPGSGDSGSGGSGSGSTNGGSDPGGTGSGSGGGSGGSGSGRVAFERVDDAGDCAGLVPSAPSPAPLTIEWNPPAGATCGGGVTDGTSHVAVSAALPGGARVWRFHAPSGAASGTATVDTLTQQDDGFHALRVAAGPGPEQPALEHVAFGPEGGERRATTVSADPAVHTSFAWAYAADPAGGGALVFQSVALGGNHWYALRATRFDAAGAPTLAGSIFESGSSPGPVFRASGVSRSGEQLALWQQSAFVSAAWLDRAGVAVANATWDAGDRAEVALGDATYGPRALELAPLLDGGLALRVDGAFRRLYAPRAGRSSPLPAWLAERADASFRFTRGNRGYAVFRPGAGTSAGDCARRIELVSPSGRLCGRAVLPAPGGACEPGAIDQGWDGGVVEQVAPGACTWRVWPRLLAR